MSKEVKVDYNKKCKCKHPVPRLVNYNMMWHDGDVICGDCGDFIRDWDAG